MPGVVTFTAADRFAQKTPYSFDASLWEFFVPWMVGATLVMAQPGGHQDSSYLCSFIQQEAITILQLVPSMLHVLVQERDFASCTSLRHMFCGGEILPLETLRRFYSLSQAQLHNLYGPTEYSIDATYWSCEPQWQENVPIGRPIANTEIYLLDAQMQPVPVGCIGELYIGGSGLALGYLNRADLTAERFLPHPFSQVSGARIYRTGDKACYRPDGVIEYLGRNDHQVKLRGYRIEPGEIEAVLHQHETVKQCAVIVHNDSKSGPCLVAYAVMREGATPDIGALRQHLIAHLPFYMQPTYIIMLAELPRLSNGKLDFNALPAPQDTLQEQPIHEEGPYSPTETIVCEICAQTLDIPRVTRDMNFFTIGGHSLLATQVINRIQQIYHIQVPLRFLFISSTIADFAHMIDTLCLAQEIAAVPTSTDESREEGIL
jgi:acyl-coenzyme A synthetase/AMP-(fatty) acid ligase